MKNIKFFLDKFLSKVNTEDLVTGLTVAGIIAFGSLLLYLFKISISKRNSFFLFFKKIRLKYLPFLFNVGISIDYKADSKLSDYFKEMKGNLEITIQQLELNKLIKIQDFSNVLPFKSSKEAEQFKSDKDLDLLVWGDFSGDNLKEDGQEVREVRLKFTYGDIEVHRKKDNKIGKVISFDINSRIALKNYWKIVDSNSFNDIKIVSNNLTEISLYILGISLKLFGRLKESRAILEKLFSLILNQENDFKKAVVLHLVHCYGLFVTDIYYKNKNLDEGILLCDNILKLQGHNIFALANKAIFLYKLNRKKECVLLVENILSFYPADPIAIVDIAFIRILEKDFNNAFKHYQKLIKLNLNFNSQEVVEFLTEEYKISKEPALLYGSGFLSYYFGDKVLASYDLKIFLENSDNFYYKKMRNKAATLLKNL